MNPARVAQIDELDSIVQSLWKPTAGQPTRRAAVDDFLDAIRKYRVFRSKNDPPHQIILGEIWQLAVGSQSRRIHEMGCSPKSHIQN
jgi:hypothetical protein